MPSHVPCLIRSVVLHTACGTSARARPKSTSSTRNVRSLAAPPEPCDPLLLTVASALGQATLNGFRGKMCRPRASTACVRGRRCPRTRRFRRSRGRSPICWWSSSTRSVTCSRFHCVVAAPLHSSLCPCSQITPPDRVGVIRRLRVPHTLVKDADGYTLDLTKFRHKTSCAASLDCTVLPSCSGKNAGSLCQVASMGLPSAASRS